MGQAKSALPVKLFVAVTYRDASIYEHTKAQLIEQFGSIDTLSAIFDFGFTQYYSEEMGVDLNKQLLGFEQLIGPASLADIKVTTNGIEAQFSINGKRQVNIDPGYLAAEKVVLATTKNFDHRIYLGKGIYGDVHLRYRGNKFIINEWTYPDYREMIVIEFFARLRKKYMKKFHKLLDQRNRGQFIEKESDL